MVSSSSVRRLGNLLTKEGMFLWDVSDQVLSFQTELTLSKIQIQNSTFGMRGIGNERCEFYTPSVYREQRLMIILAIHTLYLAFNGLLYMLIQIKYQDLDNSPFDTHMAMTTSFVALCVYFCAAALQIRLCRKLERC